jgi:DNA excision repair protein ERCC-3
MSKTRDDLGRYEEKTPPDELKLIVEELANPITTIPEVSELVESSRESVRQKLHRLADQDEIKKQKIGAKAIVWYPANWFETTGTEETILFSDRREIVVDNATEETLGQLAKFAHLVDTNQSGAAIYKIRREDIWQSPFESLEQLRTSIRSVLSEESPHLEEWIERQWERAHQFELKTHPDGFTTLVSSEADLMDEVARKKLDGQKHLYRHLSDTESRVVDGTEGTIKRILYDAGYPVQDHRELETGSDLSIDLELELREYQEHWIERFIEQGSGVFVGPSGSGKTIASIGVIEQIGGETLILVPSRELATQWRNEILENTTITSDQIGEYHGGEKEIEPITIATYQTAGMDRHRELFEQREWGLIIMDEAHHIPAPIFRRAADLQAKHRLGTTATPVRESDDEKEIFTLIGPAIGTDWQPLFADTYVQEPDVEIRYLPWGSENERTRYQSAEGHEQLQIAGMNSSKVDAIRQLRQQHDGEKALIFVEWLDQGREYQEKLDHPFISGDTPHHRRDELFEEFRQGDRDTLIISRVGDEGIDLPDAEVAIVASGLGGSRRQGAQRAGRTMRPAGNSRLYMLATRGSREEDFAQRQVQHLVEKGIRVQEVDV